MSLHVSLQSGQIYDWSDYAKAFEFKEGHFRFAAGVIVSRKTSSCLVTTYPKGGQHIDYRDEWHDGVLHYRGVGTSGDQEFKGKNRSIAENRYEIHVAENVAGGQLRYLGKFFCEGHTKERGLDKDGKERWEYHFHLRPVAQHAAS